MTTTRTPAPVIINIDGASRGNPGPAGIGIYIHKGKKSLIKRGYYIGSATNNQAEYLALAVALFILSKIAHKITFSKVQIISDSELLVKQCNDEYKIKNPALKKLRVLIDELKKPYTLSISHTLRENNTVADEMANIGVDSKRPLPAEFVALMK